MGKLELKKITYNKQGKMLCNLAYTPDTEDFEIEFTLLKEGDKEENPFKLPIYGRALERVGTREGASFPTPPVDLSREAERKGVFTMFQKIKFLVVLIGCFAVGSYVPQEAYKGPMEAVSSAFTATPIHEGIAIPPDQVSEEVVKRLKEVCEKYGKEDQRMALGRLMEELKPLGKPSQTTIHFEDGTMIEGRYIDGPAIYGVPVKIYRCKLTPDIYMVPINPPSPGEE